MPTVLRGTAPALLASMRTSVYTASPPGGSLRAWIYDRAILGLTTQWYAEVLNRLHEGAHLLDVGIGTGGALAANEALVHAHKLRVTGVDIDPDYVKKATERMRKAGLADAVDIRLQSIYDHQGGPYDAVYFSASFMLMPDPAEALRHVCTLLTDDGRIYFTQTFQDKRSKVLEKVKPMLKKATTIDFGEVTYEEDFREVVQAAGVELVELEVMERKGTRSYRLAVGLPAQASA
jgi:ubiquinone/menaquinone biosynthesis C-methylase UbiE